MTTSAAAGHVHARAQPLDELLLARGAAAARLEAIFIDEGFGSLDASSQSRGLRDLAASERCQQPHM